MKKHVGPWLFSVWIVGLFFVTLINMCAVVGIGVMRYLTKSTYNQVGSVSFYYYLRNIMENDGPVVLLPI